MDNEVHIVGISTLAAGHLTMVPLLKRTLEDGGRPDIMVVVGGVVPPEDYEALRDAGAAAIFPPGTNVGRAAAALVEDLSRRLGHLPPDRVNDPSPGLLRTGGRSKTP
jgi:methylmalonyl-CoA mutase